MQSPGFGRTHQYGQPFTELDEVEEAAAGITDAEVDQRLADCLDDHWAGKGFDTPCEP